jgi:hypothetical protein
LKSIAGASDWHRKRLKHTAEVWRHAWKVFVFKILGPGSDCWPISTAQSPFKCPASRLDT